MCWAMERGKGMQIWAGWHYGSGGREVKFEASLDYIVRLCLRSKDREWGSGVHPDQMSGCLIYFQNLTILETHILLGDCHIHL